MPVRFTSKQHVGGSSPSLPFSWGVSSVGRAAVKNKLCNFCYDFIFLRILMKSYYEFEYSSKGGDRRGKIFAESEWEAVRIFYKTHPNTIIFVQTIRKIDFFDREWKKFLKMKHVFITANFVLY